METLSKECRIESRPEERLCSEGVGLEEGLFGDWDLTEVPPPPTVTSSSHAPEILGLRSAALLLDKLTILESDCVARTTRESREEVVLSRERFGDGSLLGGEGFIPYTQEML